MTLSMDEWRETPEASTASSVHDISSWVGGRRLIHRKCVPVGANGGD